MFFQKSHFVTDDKLDAVEECHDNDDKKQFMLSKIDSTLCMHARHLL